MSLKYTRFDELVDASDENEMEIITQVLAPEDYIPPHKMAGFLPYDAILVLNDETYAAGDVGARLDEFDLAYDRVISVTENDSRRDGEALAFVSLVG